MKYKLLITAMILIILTGCSEDTLRFHEYNLASLSYIDENEEVIFKLSYGKYLNDSFLEELANNSNVEIEVKFDDIYIHFDSIEYFQEWSKLYFESSLIEYEEKSKIFYNQEIITINNQQFYEYKFNIYKDFTDIEELDEEAVILPSDTCDGLFFPIPSCFGYQVYLYTLASSTSSSEGRYKRTFETFTVEVYDEHDKYEETIEKELVKSVTFKKTSLTAVTMALSVTLIVGTLSLIIFHIVKRRRIKKYWEFLM